MKKYSLSLAVLILEISSFSFGASSISSTPCAKDIECVLFENECHELSAFLKNSLPLEYRVEEKNVYRPVPFKSSDCLRHYIVKPLWPKNPVPKCVNSECVVVSVKTPKTDGK